VIKCNRERAVARKRMEKKCERREEEKALKLHGIICQMCCCIFDVNNEEFNIAIR